MSAITIKQMADRVAALMEDRLRVKGKTLAQKVRQGGWLLPRHVRRQAKELARLSEMAQNPKLLTQVDEGKVAQAYDICLRYLNTVNVWDRRKGAMIGVGLSVLSGLLSLAILAGIFLAWRGYL